MNPANFIWRPDDHAWTRDSHVARFMRTRGLSTLAELRQASVHCHQWFWDEILRDMGVEWTRRYTQVRDVTGGFPRTRWFTGGQINVAHNCIDRHVRDGHGADTALYCEAEGGPAKGARRTTYAELAELVNRCAAALQAVGVQRGDSVGLYAPMQLATVVAMFATMKIGARFVPIACGATEETLAEQLALSDAKILLACETISRRGKPVHAGAIARAAAAQVPAIARIVWIDTGDWMEFLQSGVCIVPRHDALLRDERPALECALTDAEDPCLVVFTSGTTGRPKGTVHTHAGCLAQMGKEVRYAFDVRPGQPFLWVTDLAAMMGPWEIIGCLLYRTPVVLFDGAPNFPTSDRLWEICARLGVVTLGGSPTLIRKLMHAHDGVGPQGHDLARLRVLGAAGEIWDVASFLWYFEQVGRGRCPVINSCGAAEIGGSQLQPYPVEPLKLRSVGGPALGMDVDLFADNGKAAPRGTLGRVVCKQPAPSMTKSLLHDDAGYLATYFTRFLGVWTDDDSARVDEDGQWFACGRASDVVTIAGQRVAPAEIDSVLLSHPGVSDAATIGAPDEMGETSLVCFVVTEQAGAASAQPGESVMPLSETALIGHVTQQLGKEFAPAHVFFVSALPRTRSGKLMRDAVRRAFLGAPSRDLASVENPHALEAIAALAHPQPA